MDLKSSLVTLETTSWWMRGVLVSQKLSLLLVKDSMVKLDKICREANVKLVFVRSYGLVGIVRVSVKEHTIIDSKPDHFLDDLRLNNHGVSQTCHRGRSIVDYSFVILCCLV
ncbi:NEDD8-activating enzyme E1 regulatory subunit AXR1-like isoform X2 [Brassica napus]|uniref:NEDD8-activating enzyme E1 regulatory subunit AXR1-like isoform X2 n=1 Tax=Brassica napus TaxID=3708 RepID=UPI0006AAA22C|nr:NEDD8-activating enzyme E1 regulatory subunit AXR1-like isoform X2 [Brassica napus]XP_048621744.1 NEDD8-activating enzyme E1 regulatory subunit AXR1-like isoform X2 [Brassica napus]XP_048621745.1 NEDD8-activating enzyme E1 regulatory subunit AXR1-like isoform X2 [Brassica napus]XP_048621746.1 NEDD8-activating enzyme E1 regulatory subunit AXR1-like isoform X2 [Brassica napus]